MNPAWRRWTAWSSAAASAAVALALVFGGCGKRDEEPSGKSATPAAATASIGRVHALEGDVRILGARGEQRAQAGVLIDRSETVRTMPDAWALLAMSDGATITVRGDSELRFDDYRYDPDGEPQQNSASISLVKGALRSITGLIGQTHSAGYQVRTPTATIGIRGTDHEPAYYPPPPPGQKAEHPPGTYDKVNSGETVIRRPAGEVAVRRGQTAYAPVEVKTRPQILERVPVFYQRHAEVDRRVVDRREEFARQFTEQQQRRQQERERQHELREQKRGFEQKQRLEDQKKKQDEREKSRDAQRKKQEEQQRERQKKQGELKKKQDEERREREQKQADQRKKQAEQKREREEKREAQKNKQDEQRQEREQKQQALRKKQDEKTTKQEAATDRQSRQQQRQGERQLQLQQQREQQQLRQRERQQQGQMRQQERDQARQQQLQQQMERQRQREAQQRQQQQQQQRREPRQRDRDRDAPR